MSQVATIIATFLVLAAQCMAQSRPATALHQRESTPPAKTTTKQAAVPDSVIESAIRAKFAKSKIHEDKFTVRVQGGVATIEGHTDIIQHKGVATRLARTGGAIVVNNQIQISEAARKKASDNLEKGRRRVQVKRGDSRSDPNPPRQGH